MLSISSTPKYSVITINNWDDYQVNDQQVSNNRPTSVQQLSTYKNEKNDKNEKNVVVVEERVSFSTLSINFRNAKFGHYSKFRVLV